MDDIEKKIKNKIDSYQIQTTSSDVLDSFQKTKKHNPIILRRILLGAFSSCCAIAIIAGVTIYIATSNKDVAPFIPNLTNNESKLIDNQIGILSLNIPNHDLRLSIKMEKENANHGTLKSDDEDSTKESNYEESIYSFDKSAESMYFILNDIEDEIVSTSKTLDNPITINDVKYSTVITYSLNNNDLYSLYLNFTELKNNKNKVEWEYNGVLLSNSTYYSISGTKEFKAIKNEYDLESSITMGNYVYKIEKEIDNEEASFEFTTYPINDDDNEIYSYEIEKALNEETCEIAVHNNNEYEYTVIKNSKTEFSITSNLDIDTKLVFSDTTRTYSSSSEAIIVINR